MSTTTTAPGSCPERARAARAACDGPPAATAIAVSDDTAAAGGAEASATFTFLFTDMEGSTARWESTPETAALVDRHFEVLHDAIAAEAGHVFASMGDGVAAAFESASAGVRAAVDAQRHLLHEGIDVRMGLHTGEVLLAGDDYRGRAVNRAARIAAVGHGGQILLSAVTAHLLRTGPDPVDLRDLGSHRLRDLTEPEHIWQVLDPELSPTLPPLRSLDACPNNLPIQRSEFIGRERDVARVVALLEHHRVVTLIGPGGVGKTRLALQAAAERSASAQTSWFASLAGVDEADDVVRAIAIAMRIDPTANPLEAIRAAFASRRAVLVLDNCEHLVDAAADAVDQLTEACRDLRVVATSREPLEIDGEFVIPVRPLDPEDEALELFELRASAVGAPLRASQRELARQICRRLDGLPLAIELAAARVPTLGLSAIVDALDDRFWLLSGGRRAAGDRHHTMRATVGWSYQLLEPEARRLLEWMATFPGGFELDAVRHVAAMQGLEPAAAPDVIGSLVRKSMVEADLSAPVVRYHLLETVRAYALEALHERGEGQRAAVAQAEWVADLTGLPIHEPCDAQVERNAIRLEREADNWRKAVQTAHRIGSCDLAARLCGPPTCFFLLGRYDLCDVLLPLLDICHDPVSRRAVVSTVAVASAGGADPMQVRRWSDELAVLEGDLATGAAELVEWMALSWEGRVDDAVALCLRAADDERYSRDTRDLFLGIATTDCFSLTQTTEDADVLAARALEAARRTDVGIQRVTCLLGAAWALLGTEPDRSMALTQEAFQGMPHLPSFLQRTLPGNAARLVTRIDTRSAALELLERLDGDHHPSTYVDLIPAFYATELLHRLGNPLAGTALATIAASPLASYLTLRNFDALAMEAAEQFAPVSLDELSDLLRAELRAIATTSDLATTSHPQPQPSGSLP
jgi:predicted ATPase/class 3 adenylate cyclase